MLNKCVLSGAMHWIEKFMLISDIITQYHLEKQFSLEDYEIRKSKRPGQPEIKDDNLKKLWKKAMMEGFAGNLSS